MLPVELRASCYPVTLYTVANGCEPCVAARATCCASAASRTPSAVCWARGTAKRFIKLTGGRDAPVLPSGRSSSTG